MLRWIFRRKLDAEEKKLGESMDYLRHIVDVSPTAFLRFASIMPFANSRKALSKEAWYAAQLTALQQEDCGPCLQIGVNLARKDQVDAETIRSILARDKDRLSEELVEILEFTVSIVEFGEDPTELRESIKQRHGDRGLIELSYAIASSRIPPTVKRVLGFATSCKLTRIEVTGTAEQPS